MKKPDDIFQSVNILPLLSFWWLRDINDDLPQCHVVQIWREDGLWQQLSQYSPGVGLSDVLLEQTVGTWTTAVLV